MISMMVWNWIYYDYYCHNHHHHNCHHYGIWIFKIIIIWTKKTHHRYSSSDELWFLSSLLDESKQNRKKRLLIVTKYSIFFLNFKFTNLFSCWNGHTMEGKRRKNLKIKTPKEFFVFHINPAEKKQSIFTYIMNEYSFLF